MYIDTVSFLRLVMKRSNNNGYNATFFVLNSTSACMARDVRPQKTQVLMGRMAKGMRSISYEFNMLCENMAEQ